MAGYTEEENEEELGRTVVKLAKKRGKKPVTGYDVIDQLDEESKPIIGDFGSVSGTVGYGKPQKASAADRAIRNMPPYKPKQGKQFSGR